MTQPYEGTDILELLTEATQYNNSIVRYIIKEAPALSDIVDFGAGIGTFPIILRNCGRNILCVEQDSRHKSILQSKGFQTYSNFIEIQNPPSFLYSLNVLEHIENDLEVLKSIYNHLPNNSKIFIYVPALNWLWTDLDDNVNHYRRYSRKTLKNTLEKAGFKVNKIHYCDFAGVLVTMIFKLLKRSSKKIRKSDIIFYDKFVFRVSQCLDPLFNKLAGKNVIAIAWKK